MNRRDFLKSVGLGVSVMFVSDLVSSCVRKKNRPNILWITSEDNGPFLGCYGDKFANTPNLDRLAAEGILYENAFATAPVCAPARSTIISGMYPLTMGTQHMRSKNKIPAFIKFFPQYLREVGYYCTNNHKEDYNMPKPEGVWDESSRKAHYKNRAPGQPFFAIFNLTVSHESSIHKPMKELKHDPARVKLPPYHPDTPEIRHDWAQYYDKIEELDRQVGRLLKELEDEGLADDTIVFYYSDNAGVLPRSKRFVYDSGLHVPFIVRFPPKYQHLAPGKPGTKTDRLISFVDLAPTMLSLVGIKIPEHMQGVAFLGPQAGEPRKYIYAFRGRMDERYDMMRVVRDKQFKYIRNYNPHRIYAQHVEYLWRAPAMQSWEKMYREGKCNEIQSIFWNTKPPEELYDVKADPHEVHNLADDPQYQDTLKRLREACHRWMLEIRDSGFIPEGEMLERAKRKTIYEVVREPDFPLEKIIETADMATMRKPEYLDELIRRMNDPESVVRYWAVTGCLVLGKKAKSAVDAVKKVLNDNCGDVRVAAAEFLCQMGYESEGLPVLIRELQNENSKVALRAISSLEYLGRKARPALAALKTAAKREDDNYIKRAAGYAIEVIQKA